MISEAELTRTRIKMEAIVRKLDIKLTSLREEIVLAKFIEGKLLKAAKLFLKYVRFGQPVQYSYLECLKSVWKDHFVCDGDIIEFEVDDPLIKEVYPEICQITNVDSNCRGTYLGRVKHSL